MISHLWQLRHGFEPIVFLPAAQSPDPAPFGQVLIRSSLPEAAVTAAAREAVAEVAPSASISFDMLDEQIRSTLQRERLMATLSEFFGLVAALLAAIGLYGIVSFTVARRTREIGIRLALGADRRRIFALIVRDTLELLGVGLAVGLGLALVGARAASSFLYGLGAHDPVTLAIAVALMAAVAVVASLVPVRRAARVDPMVALRME